MSDNEESPKFRSVSHTWKDVTSPIYNGLEVIGTHTKSKARLSGRARNSLSTSSVDSTDGSKGKYSTYMEKEIMDQPIAIKQAMAGRVDFKNHKVNLRGMSKLQF